MLIVQPLPEAYEILVTFKLSAGHDSLEWQVGPWLARPDETPTIPVQLPSDLSAIPRIGIGPAHLSVRIDAGPYTATPQGAVLLPTPQGGLGLYLDPDVLEGLEFPGSNRPGKQQRVDERIARAQRLEQLPPGDTGLGGAQ